MPKDLSDDWYPSKKMFSPREQKIRDELHDIDNYKMACQWYKSRLLNAISQDLPSHQAENWTDEDVIVTDEWVDALCQSINRNQENLFYEDLKNRSWATSKLVNAFKKLEIMYMLEATLADPNASNSQKIENFHGKLKEHKDTLIALRRNNDPLDTFVRMLGVACAAILGLAGLGVGAYFAGAAGVEHWLWGDLRGLLQSARLPGA